MKSSKRLVIATLGGLFFGLVCYSLASSGPEPLPFPVVAQIITSRLMMGFAIGLSRFTFGHWTIHGILLGILFSLPLAFGGLMAPENPEFSSTEMMTWTIVFGAVYGLIIELLTTVLFKAGAK